MLCLMSESPSGKREGFQDNAIRKKGSLLLTQVRASAATNAVVQGQKPRAQAVTQIYRVSTQVVGLSRLVTSLQSNFIGQNFRMCGTFLGVSAQFLIS